MGENSVRTDIIYHGDCLVESDKLIEKEEKYIDIIKERLNKEG